MSPPEPGDSAFVTVSLAAVVPVLFMSLLFVENRIFVGEGDEVYCREASARKLVTCQNTQFHDPRQSEWVHWPPGVKAYADATSEGGGCWQLLEALPTSGRDRGL